MNKDFYEELPGMVCAILDDLIEKYGDKQWFNQAWEEYRQHIKDNSMDDMKMPGYVFNKYIDNKKKQQELKMSKKIVIIFILFLAVFGITGCSRDSEKASYNVSKEADNFKTKRRIVFINLRTDSYLFEIIGNCSITTDNTDDQLEVICKVGEDKYQKHFLRMTTEVTYTVEQLDYSEVSKYDYEITFKPEAIVPIKIKTED